MEVRKSLSEVIGLETDQRVSRELIDQMVRWTAAWHRTRSLESFSSVPPLLVEGTETSPNQSSRALFLPELANLIKISSGLLLQSSLFCDYLGQIPRFWHRFWWAVVGIARPFENNCISTRCVCNSSKKINYHFEKRCFGHHSMLLLRPESFFLAQRWTEREICR